MAVSTLGEIVPSSSSNQVPLHELNWWRVAAIIGILGSLGFLAAFIWYIIASNQLTEELNGYKDPLSNEFRQSMIPVAGSLVPANDFKVFQSFVVLDNPRACKDICASIPECRAATWYRANGVCSLYQGEAILQVQETLDPDMYAYDKQ